MKEVKVLRVLGLIFLLCEIIINLPTNCYSKKPAKNIFVVIDPGHGGKDPGAMDYIYWTTGDKSYEHTEKYYNLEGAKRLALGLEIQGIKIEMTRSIEEYIPIWLRIERAKKWIKDSKAKFEFFISYHHNSSETHKETGTEALIRPGQEEISEEFANKMIDRVAGVGFKRRSLKITTKRTAVLNWKVLCPSIIAEICFIDAKSDYEKLLISGEAITNALVQSVMETAKENLGVVVTNVSPVGTVYSPGRPKISATLTSIDKNPATGLYENIVKSSIKMYVRKKYGPIVEPVPLNYDPDIEQADSFRIWHIPTSHLDYYEPYVVHLRYSRSFTRRTQNIRM